MLSLLAFISMPRYTEWFMILIGIAVLYYWIRTIAHVSRSQFQSTAIKAIWLIVVLVFGVVGAFIYDVAGRQSAVRTDRNSNR